VTLGRALRDWRHRRDLRRWARRNAYPKTITRKYWTPAVIIRASDVNSHMSRYLVDRLVCHPRIEVMTGANIVGLDGDDALQAVRVDRTDTQTRVPATIYTYSGRTDTHG
jgi:hypothetical protein